MRKTPLLLALAAIGFAGSAAATDGMFSDGYGMTAKGMGGAATAMADDSFGGANNPASMVWVGNRIDLGADLFSPHRSADRTGSGVVPPGTPGAPPGGVDLNGSADSGMKYFLIPEFGYNRMIKDNLSLGVTVYGNGGMNTTYNGGQINCGAGANTANLLCGSGQLGVNLMQLIIAPTVAYKLNDSHSVGISPLFGYQRFKAEGLAMFAGFSSDTSHVSDNGSDHASGWGVRVGWLGRITPTLTLGAAYSSKIDMSKFDQYRGLFADGGKMDIPENYNLGLAFKAMPNLTLALDYQRINYGGVPAIGNASGNSLNFTGANPLGTSNGSGFGWKDVNVWKLGAEYRMNDKLTLRAGYNHTDNPIQSADVTINILAPGVIKDHATLGMSYAVNNTSDLTIAYMHAFKHSVTGNDMLGQIFGVGGTDTIKMYQDSLGVAYSWKL